MIGNQWVLLQLCLLFLVISGWCSRSVNAEKSGANVKYLKPMRYVASSESDEDESEEKNDEDNIQDRIEYEESEDESLLDEKGLFHLIQFGSSHRRSDNSEYFLEDESEDSSDEDDDEEDNDTGSSDRSHSIDTQPIHWRRSIGSRMPQKKRGFPPPPKNENINQINLNWPDLPDNMKSQLHGSFKGGSWDAVLSSNELADKFTMSYNYKGDGKEF